MPAVSSENEKKPKGKTENKKEEKSPVAAPAMNLSAAAETIGKMAAGTGLEIVLYEKTGMGNGSQANNPWLQEFPDPISKITWDNYLSLSQKYAADNNLSQGDVVSLEANGNTMKIPVVVQPGQAYGTASVAVGYGRTMSGKAGNGVGVNAYPLMTTSGNAMHMMVNGAKITKTSEPVFEFAATQTHHTMMGREIVKETTLKEYLKNPAAGNEEELTPTPKGNCLLKK